MEITINTLLQSHFLRLYQMACADRNFGVLEMKQLYKFAVLRGVGTEHLDAILKKPVYDLEVPQAIEKKIEYLYDMAIMIWADREVTEDEYNLLRKYCETFEFLPGNIDEICTFLIDCAKQEKELQEILDALN